MRKVAIVLVILVSFVAAAAQQGTGPASLPSVTLPPELDRVLRDYETAWAAKDAARLAKLFAEDGYVLPGGSPPVKGRPRSKLTTPATVAHCFCARLLLLLKGRLAISSADTPARPVHRTRVNSR